MSPSCSVFVLGCSAFVGVGNGSHGESLSEEECHQPIDDDRRHDEYDDICDHLNHRVERRFGWWLNCAVRFAWLGRFVWVLLHGRYCNRQWKDKGQRGKDQGSELFIGASCESGAAARERSQSTTAPVSRTRPVRSMAQRVAAVPRPDTARRSASPFWF